MTAIELRAGSIVVRDWREDDAAALAVQANDRRVWLGLRDAFPHPYSLADAHAFIALARGMSPRTFLTIDVNGGVAGDGRVLDQLMYAILRDELPAAGR